MKISKKESRSKYRSIASGTRLLVCGKGGSGKSSIVTLMANVLTDKGYKVLVLDADASNPGGLSRLLCGLKKGPSPLIEFFGGRKKVECPVDNPSPLTRQGETIPITKKNIDIMEIPPEYFFRKGNLIFFQVGKIHKACEGCDGPMSKVTRDFLVKGNQITIIDVEAGIEHFGRGVEKNIDIVFVVVDPSAESFAIAEKVSKLCRDIGVKKVWAILNKVKSKELETLMISGLRKKKVKILGTIYDDPEVANANLLGKQLGNCSAKYNVKRIIEILEERL